MEADESDDEEKNYPVWSRRKFCLNDLGKTSEARKRFIKNIFDIMEELEDVALQNSAELRQMSSRVRPRRDTCPGLSSCCSWP